MAVLYVRVADEISDYIHECSAESGLSIAKTAEVLLEACKRRGWRVTKSVGQVREPE